MTDPHPPIDVVLQKAVDACDRAGIAYAIIGGIAAITYGVPRFTRDVDLVLGLARDEREALARFLNELVAEGFRVDAAAVQKRLERGRNLFRAFLGLTRVDFLLKRPDAYWQDALAHRRRVEYLGRGYWFASPEDVVALKIVAGRPTDLQDVGAILRVHRATIDRSRLRATVGGFAKNLERPDLAEALERHLAEADALPEEPAPDS